MREGGKGATQAQLEAFDQGKQVAEVTVSGVRKEGRVGGGGATEAQLEASNQGKQVTEFTVSVVLRGKRGSERGGGGRGRWELPRLSLKLSIRASRSQR